MKEEIMPDIPQENIAQTQSMYEQLRKTSQKWFNGSHRRIFTNSNISSKQSLKEKGMLSDRTIQSNISEWNLPVEKQQKIKIMNFMRQQIEIGCTEYTNRMKRLLLDQAKKIKLLGDLLVKNQMELQRKDKIIQQLASIIDDNLPHTSEFEFDQINQKILESQEKLDYLSMKISQIQNSEDKINSKFSSIEKIYKQKLAQLSTQFHKKLSQTIEDYEQRIDKIEKILALNHTEPKYNRRGSIGQISQINTISKSVEYFSCELDDLRQQVESFKKKKYHYQNFKIQEVQGQIKNIQMILNKYEKSLSHHPSLGNLKSSQTTNMTRTESNFFPKSQTSKTRFLNKYKSLINTRQENRPNIKQSCLSESQSESEVQQTFVESGGNINRLKKIIKQMNMNLPVRLQIDQTGYAKSTDTGMYLVDSQGDGFQFTCQEIRYLTSNKIIAT